MTTPTAETAASNDGLSTAEASRRLAQDGPNAIANVAEHPLQQALRKLWAPVPWMLEAAIILQLGLREYLEAGLVTLLLVFNAGLGFVQQRRAQSTLDALKSRLALVASVRRDGVWTSVPAANLVAGDLVKLSLGSVVAADVRLIEGSVLLDQSMLTGESLPVEAGAGVEAHAGALVRRGEAVAIVIATGERTKFGHSAELVRTAKVESSEQRAIMHVVGNLAMFNGCVTAGLTGYALVLHLPFGAIVPLILVAVLASIPVALPSMFTLAAAVGARALARAGVLPTSLAAVDEAAGIDVLCSDKTGTLTRNELAVMAVKAMPGFEEPHVLAVAALASSDGGQDAVDAAIQAEARRRPTDEPYRLVRFIPFDPALRRAEATICAPDGTTAQAAKGAFAAIQALCPPLPAAAAIVDGLQAQGFRIIAVATGPAGALHLAGIIALSDPPRDDAAALIAELAGLGIRTIMVTGDAPITAGFVAKAIGLSGSISSVSPLPERIAAEDPTIYAGVLPEDKFRLIKALQASGHLVGMCGDGANDAPALRQAQMGIAVSTATDVAKSAAGIVLTEPGLAGVVAAVKEGRSTYQRVLTYTLRSIVNKVVQVLFLTAGLVMTGQAILTPMLMVLMMVTGDFLAMSSSTDNVRPSPRPSVWKIGGLTIAGIALGIVDLCFCVGSLAIGHYALHLDIASLRTLAVVTLVFSGQAVFYVARERRHIWSSIPGRWLLICSTIDLALISLLAIGGILMSSLSAAIVASLLGAAILLAVILDLVKLAMFRRLDIG